MKRTTALRSALLIYSISALLTLVTPHAALSEELERENFQLGGLDIGFLPKLYGGVMYYKYKQNAIVSPDIDNMNLSNRIAFQTGSPFTAEVLFPILGGGGTLFVDRFFVDVYVQHAFSQSDTSGQVLYKAQSNVTLDPPNAPSDYLTRVTTTRNNNNIDLERTEGAVSVGYAVTDQFSVFAGYRRADTDFDTKEVGTQIEDATISNNPATNMPAGQRRSIDAESDVQTDYEQKGPFVGFAYGVPITKQPPAKSRRVSIRD